jgi:hypothetical protein
MSDAPGGGPASVEKRAAALEIVLRRNAGMPERADISQRQTKIMEIDGNSRLAASTRRSSDLAPTAPDDHIAFGVNAMDLKNRLCDVETDCRNRLRSPVLRIRSPHGDHGTYVPVEEPSTASGADIDRCKHRHRSGWTQIDRRTHHRTHRHTATMSQGACQVRQSIFSRNPHPAEVRASTQPGPAAAFRATSARSQRR